MKSVITKIFTATLAISSAIYAGVGAGKGMTYALAFSHDGNAYDLDDIGAVAWAQAMVDAWGRSSAIVHLDYNCNTSKVGNHGADMIASVQGAIQRFHTPKEKTFDDLTQADAAVANFKAEADKLDATHGLIYMCGGPMEIPWRCLNATALEKRKYIIIVSHSAWNDNFTGPNSTHTWASLGQLPGGAVLDHIAGQNRLLGLGSDWSKLSSIGPDFAWLLTRDLKTGGDVSDAGMTWYALTGSDAGTPADVMAQFAKRGGTTGIKVIGNGRLNVVTNFKTLRVQVPEFTNSLSLKVSDLSGHTYQIAQEQSKNGWIEIPTSGLANGNYILSLKDQSGKLSQSGMFIVNN